MAWQSALVSESQLAKSAWLARCGISVFEASRMASCASRIGAASAFTRSVAHVAANALIIKNAAGAGVRRRINRQASASRRAVTTAVLPVVSAAQRRLSASTLPLRRRQRNVAAVEGVLARHRRWRTAAGHLLRIALRRRAHPAPSSLPGQPYGRSGLARQRSGMRGLVGKRHASARSLAAAAAGGLIRCRRRQALAASRSAAYRRGGKRGSGSGVSGGVAHRQLCLGETAAAGVEHRRRRRASRGASASARGVRTSARNSWHQTASAACGIEFIARESRARAYQTRNPRLTSVAQLSGGDGRPRQRSHLINISAASPRR